MTRLLIRLIEAYRYMISPLMGHHCRFIPSCSRYALDALEKYGIAQASWLIIKRILRCHPWCKGGHDPVP
ncbi:MAG: membrane protein insertion efficiency factor YidD [Methylophilaceae bacterium]|nr:membrane protein insertion efficiency factor YidD [Methylophilaceae bacterium]